MDAWGVVFGILEQGVPTWAVLTLSLLAFYLMFFKERNSSGLANRKQFYEEQQNYIENIQTQLIREQKYGQQQAARVNELGDQLIELRIKHEYMDRQINALMNCSKPDCPLRSIRDTIF